MIFHQLLSSEPFSAGGAFDGACHTDRRYFDRGTALRTGDILLHFFAHVKILLKLFFDNNDRRNDGTAVRAITHHAVTPGHR